MHVARWITQQPCVKPGFHSNAIACVGKQPIMVATASTEHSYWLALAFVAWCQRKRLRFLRFSFTQRTQRKRLRLNGNRALVTRVVSQRASRPAMDILNTTTGFNVVLFASIYYTHKRIKEIVSCMAAACSRNGDWHQLFASNLLLAEMYIKYQ